MLTTALYIAALLVASPISVDRTMIPHAQRCTRSARAEGVVVEIAVPNRTPVGKPIPMVIRVTNTNRHPIDSGDNGYVPDCKATTIDRATGQTIEFTLRGNRRINGDPPSGRSQYSFGRLEEWQSRTWGQPAVFCDLTECYDLPAGSYSMDLAVRIRRNNCVHTFYVTVKDVQFEVTESVLPVQNQPTTDREHR